MNEIIKKNKVYLVVAIYLVIIFAVCFFFFIPTITKIRTIAYDIQKQIVDNEIIHNRIADIPEMKKNSEAYQNRKKEISGAIFEEGKEFDFVSEVENLAENTGNKISLKIEDNPTKATGKNKKDESVLTLPSDNYMKAQINLEGNFESFLNFLNQLENFGNYVNPISFSFSKNKVEEAAPAPKDIFSPDSQTTVGQSSPQEIEEKEILKITIETVVYKRKKL